MKRSGGLARAVRLAPLGWALVLVFLASQAMTVEDRLSEPSFVIDGRESAVAADIDRRHFGPGIEFPILLEGPPSALAPQSAQLVEELAAKPRTRAFAIPAPRGQRHRIVVAIVGRPGSESLTAAREVRSWVRERISAPVVARPSGEATIVLALQEATFSELRKGELIALPILMVILLFVFRSLVAAAIPLAFGAVNVIAGYGAISLVGRLIDLDVLALALASMVGLALGVDYSLLMVSRFREELAQSGDSSQASRTAARVAGRTVMLAGLVLVVAMVTASVLSPGSFIASSTVGVAVVTITSAISTRLIMPPLLAALGGRVNAGAVRLRRERRSGRRLDRLLAAVLRRPAAAAIGCGAILTAVALPAIALQPETPGPGLLPAGSQVREDYERARDLIGPGWAAPFMLVAVDPRGPLLETGGLLQLARFQRQLAHEDGVAETLGPQALTGAANPLAELDANMRESVGWLASRRDQLHEVEGFLTGLSTATNEIQAGLVVLGAVDKPDPVPVASSSRGAGRILKGGARRIDASIDALSAVVDEMQRRDRHARRRLSRLLESSDLLSGLSPGLSKGTYGRQYSDEGKRALLASRYLRRARRSAQTVTHGTARVAGDLAALELSGRALADRLQGLGERQPRRSMLRTRGFGERVTDMATSVGPLHVSVSRVQALLDQSRLQIGMSKRLIGQITAEASSAAVERVEPAERDELQSVLNVDRGGQAGRMLIVAQGEPGAAQSARLSDLLIRRAAEFSAETGIATRTGGQGQVLIDVRDAIQESLPILLLGLSLVSWIVLAIALRALLAPLVAVLLNVLSVGVALSVLALLYQGDDPLLGGPGYISAIAALSIFGVTFGLSIDYEVFLLSRMREGWDRTGDAEAAILQGVKRTARVITGAALVMAAVFLSFALTGFAANQQLGIGLTVAILIDATLVRLILLPALLQLCGPRAWWMPSAQRAAGTRPAERRVT